MTTVAERLVQTFEAAGIARIFGLVGDSLNGITDALRGHDDFSKGPINVKLTIHLRRIFP